MSTSSPGYGWTLDLLAVAVLTLLSAGVLLGLSDSVLTLLVGVPFLVFLPGYAIVSALFPEHPVTESTGPMAAPRNSGPNWAVRIALSLLLSGLIVGVLGVVLDWVATISLALAVAAIVAVTLVGVAVASVRRSRQPAEYRASPVSGEVPALLPAGSTRQRATLALAIVALLGATVFVGVAPTQGQGESYSEAYVLTEGENGDLVAEGYPTTFVAGEGHPLTIGLENHEHETVSYEIVVVAQTVAEDGSVTEQEQVDQFGAELGRGETTMIERQIAPTTTGQERRLVFEVYENAAPENADPDHTMHLWIDVVEE